jgi:hypothetical protein
MIELSQMLCVCLVLSVLIYHLFSVQLHNTRKCILRPGGWKHKEPAPDIQDRRRQVCISIFLAPVRSRKTGSIWPVSKDASEIANRGMMCGACSSIVA